MSNNSVAKSNKAHKILERNYEIMSRKTDNVELKTKYCVLSRYHRRCWVLQEEKKRLLNDDEKKQVFDKHKNTKFIFLTEEELKKFKPKNRKVKKKDRKNFVKWYNSRFKTKRKY